MVVTNFIFLLILYFDDLMITWSFIQKIEWLQQLCEQFTMSLFGPLSLYLGVDFFYTFHSVMLSHQLYLLKCFIDMDLINRFPNPIPMDPNSKLSLEMDSPLFVASTITYYRMGVGKLLHVTNNHLNIAYSIGVVIRFITILHEAHLEVMIFIFATWKGLWILHFIINEGEISYQLVSLTVVILTIWISTNLFLIICLI